MESDLGIDSIKRALYMDMTSDLGIDSIKRI
jgi:hypothetical protein